VPTDTLDALDNHMTTQRADLLRACPAIPCHETPAALTAPFNRSAEKNSPRGKM
jgi:hypothetical protein